MEKILFSQLFETFATMTDSKDIQKLMCEIGKEIKSVLWRKGEKRLAIDSNSSS